MQKQKNAFYDALYHGKNIVTSVSRRDVMMIGVMGDAKQSAHALSSRYMYICP